MTARRRVLVLAHLLFLVSGALGLVYEVLWMRRFTALLGSSSVAAAATLSAVFLGFAAGSLIVGARSRGFRRPLFAFGTLEIGVGAGAVLTEPLLAAIAAGYPGLHASLSGHPTLFLGVKLALAMLTVALPTTCMGGTLPALARFAVTAEGGLGVPVGGLYASNLVGAVVGTLVVPFVLLPWLGATGTFACAVGGSLLVGSLACLRGRGSPEAPAAPDRWSQGDATGHRPERATFVLAGLSGGATLALQVLWTRAFALVHANSIQAFAVVLATFLAGLAGGAALARRRLRAGRTPGGLLGAAWLLAGLFVAAAPPLFHRLTGGLAFLPASAGGSPLGALVELAAVLVLPSTLALGTVMPLLLQALGRVAAAVAGRETGRLVAANTVGAIAGPLIATFVLGPLLGLWTSLFTLGAVLLAAGAWVTKSRPIAVAATAGLALVALMAPPWRVPPVRVETGERLLSLREDSYGTTAVLEDAHDRWISVNNSYVLGGTAEGLEERFQAHLPLLLHSSPREVAVLGLGTGLTAGAALQHDLEHVTIFEIVPQVAAAARADFGDANGRVLDDRRVSLVLDDARPHIAAMPGRFDVVVADLLVPWRPGEAPLYAVEHLRAVRRALRPGGLFCQWLPVYQLSDDQLDVAARTFLEVFPEATLWRGNFLPDVLTLGLVGHLGGSIDPPSIDDRLSKIARRSGDPFLQHAAGLWLHLVGPLRKDDRLVAGARLNSDAHPWLELMSAAAAARRGATASTRMPPLLERVSEAPLDGTPLQSLDDVRDRWRRTGALLYRAARERRPEGEVLGVLRGLPIELQRALGAAPEPAETGPARK